MRKSFPLFIILSLVLLNTVVNAQPGKNQLKTVNSINEASGKPAILNLSNGKGYKIDFWSDPHDSNATGPKAAPMNCNDNHFTGTDRKAAKTSNVSQSTYKTYVKINDVLHVLPSDAIMMKKVTKTSPRINVENNGAILDNVFIYAFKRESDNDYHVIVGDNANFSKATLLNMEISGLASPDNPDLDNARSNFLKAFKINDKTCMASYVVFSANPVPAHIEGAVFYDIDHAPGSIGPINGKIKLRPKTAWEVHPITKFSLR